MAMGLVRGVKVKVVKVAPLGDPMELEVLGYHLSLRREEAHCIRVVWLDEHNSFTQDSGLPVSS
jgi:Fe2+ transport system protein FeoA